MPDVRRTFHLERLLGRGGFGEVWLARMASPSGLEVPVAVKLLTSDLTLDAGALARLRDEASLLARLDHPAILHVVDRVRLAGRTGLVTEYVDGLDLSTCLRRRPALPLPCVLAVLAQVASALEAAWNAEGDAGPLRLVHRDVKPANIRIGRHGQVKLLDFGIARFEGALREAWTSSDEMVGSLPYVAPECFSDAQTTGACDVWSLGATLYEAVRGERFHRRTDARALGSIALDPVLFDAHLTNALAAESVGAIRDLLQAMLAWDPARRPSAGEVADRLESRLAAFPPAPIRHWMADQPAAPPPRDPGSLAGVTHVEEIYGPTTTEPVHHALRDLTPPPAPPPARQGSWIPWVGAIAVTAFLLLGATALGLAAAVGWWAGS